MKQRPIEVLKDKDGKTFVRVPCGPRAECHAEIEFRDWENLLSLGYTGNLGFFELRRNGKRYATLSDSKSKGGVVLAARIIADAKPGQRVHFVDGNPLNLRRSNLELRSTRADTMKGSDAAYQ